MRHHAQYAFRLLAAALLVWMPVRAARATITQPPAAASLVRDIGVGSRANGGSCGGVSPLIAELPNGVAVLALGDSLTTGCELWRSDGTGVSPMALLSATAKSLRFTPSRSARKRSRGQASRIDRIPATAQVYRNVAAIYEQCLMGSRRLAWCARSSSLRLRCSPSAAAVLLRWRVTQAVKSSPARPSVPRRWQASTCAMTQRQSPDCA